MSGHTAGGWARFGRTVVSTRDEWICELPPLGASETANSKNEANARLIAAAPDLLAGAKNSLARYPEQNLLRDAVKKAEGE